MLGDAEWARMEPHVASSDTRYNYYGELFGSSSEAARTTTSAVFSARSLSNRAMLPSYAAAGAQAIPPKGQLWRDGGCRSAEAREILVILMPPAAPCQDGGHLFEMNDVK